MSFWMVLLERSSSGSIRLALLALGPVAAIAFGIFATGHAYRRSRK